MSSTRRAKQFAEVTLPAEIVAQFPAIVEALSRLDAAEAAFEDAQEALYEVEDAPREHKAAVRKAIETDKKPPVFDAIAHDVRLGMARDAHTAAARAVRAASVAYGQSIVDNGPAIAAMLAERAEEARAVLLSHVDALRPAFDEFASLHNLAEALGGDAMRNAVSRETVLYRGPVKVGRFVDALDILDRAAHPTASTLAAHYRAIKTGARYS